MPNERGDGGMLFALVGVECHPRFFVGEERFLCAREALEHALTLAVTAIVRVRDIQPAGLIGELALELLGARGGTSDASAVSAHEVGVHCWERQGAFVVWLHPSANCRGAKDAATLLTLQEAIQQAVSEAAAETGLFVIGGEPSELI